MPTKVPALITTSLVVVAAVFPILSFVTIAFRYKARRLARQPFQSDDYWIIVSWVHNVYPQHKALADLI